MPDRYLLEGSHVLVLLQDDVRLSKVFNSSGVGPHVNCLLKPRRQFEDELKPLDQPRHTATTASHAEHINNHTRMSNKIRMTRRLYVFTQL